MLRQGVPVLHITLLRDVVRRGGVIESCSMLINVGADGSQSSRPDFGWPVSVRVAALTMGCVGTNSAALVLHPGGLSARYMGQVGVLMWTPLGDR